MKHQKKEHRVIEGQIPTRTYQDLRAECGLSGKTDLASEIGLQNSVHSVMIEIEGNVIGMGRLIGDGGCFCQIVDICVHPEFQGSGFGKMIMQNLSDFINEELPSSCYVSLLADGNAYKLYEQFGFKETMPSSRGMYLSKE
ncbi:MAG: GNAT family N-acetyltransferase [Flavobacteriales bacterium]|nr:GNAT family N-acetyltransferase [Flavobacteriales bacterium]